MVARRRNTAELEIRDKPLASMTEGQVLAARSKVFLPKRVIKAGKDDLRILDPSGKYMVALKLATQGKTYDQIAEEMGRSVAEVKRLVFYMLKENSDLSRENVQQHVELQVRQMKEMLSTHLVNATAGNTASAEVALKIMKDLRYLLGFDTVLGREDSGGTVNIKISYVNDWRAKGDVIDVAAITETPQ